MKNIETDCDASLSQDRSLPTNAFLIEYSQAGISQFDIVAAAKQVDIFDDYWDKYKTDFKNMSQAEGRISPRLWKAPKK